MVPEKYECKHRQNQVGPETLRSSRQDLAASFLWFIRAAGLAQNSAFTLHLLPCLPGVATAAGKRGRWRKKWRTKSSQQTKTINRLQYPQEPKKKSPSSLISEPGSRKEINGTGASSAAMR